MDSHEEVDDINRSSCWKMFFKEGVLKNFAILTGKHLCLSLLHRETPTQVFSCEDCGIFKNTFFQRTPPVAAFLLSYCFS